MKEVTSWGNYPVVQANFDSFACQKKLEQTLMKKGDYIAYGNGRSYGDASLGENVVSTRQFNKVLSFDKNTGFLRCQSGILFSELIDLFLHRGWFLPVTPGTKLLTVGGAIAADVHGKNHHVKGSFGQHVVAMTIMRNDGSVIRCSASQNSDIYQLTIGGMGLTGIILEVEFYLQKVESAHIYEEKVKCRNLQEIMSCFEQSHNWTYSVAWIDCLATGKNMGRSIMMRGEHVSRENPLIEKYAKAPLYLNEGVRLNVPVMLPNIVLNGLTMRAFNFTYYNMCKQGLSSSITDINRFFYPLDAINNWNRIYGKRGFTQYQFVLPFEAGYKGLQAILKRITDSGLGSFLAVLKLFGEQNSLISFPMKGYTLALDFPISQATFALFNELDSMVLDYGGRLYLAKDCRMNSEMFLKCYSNAHEFCNSVATLNEGGTRFSSALAKRLEVF